MKNTIGIVGSGMIGGQTARLAIAGGYDVVICNSRGPSSLVDLVKELGPQARAATLPEVAAAADLIVLAIPFAVFATIPADVLAGKILIDTLNYYPERDGDMMEVHTDTVSTSELVQRHFARSTVVRALNNVDFVRLLTSAREAGDADRSALPVAGNDADAKSQVISFLDGIGYDFVDMGDLAQAWRSEPTMPIYVEPYMTPETNYVAKQVTLDTFLAAPGRTVSKQEAANLIAKAVRHDKMFGKLPVFANADT
ncbi:NAD(P)-binding domain-containing protein [Agrobacterium sp. Ap1]|uniref:NADPH-dependent F420 reductase n=1 Tax=Agrobacterium sp. Ap1 TaxID=2815337 RepID=UPI001A8C280D|nr:NAD(P)-binding domain-containing protein [Agrobacterium sp. Ap1]MBO0144643.1 NAD(P)-binding domain-containing protein [Agrobacterium sp. Ap1]